MWTSLHRSPTKIALVGQNVYHVFQCILHRPYNTVYFYYLTFICHFISFYQPRQCAAHTDQTSVELGGYVGGYHYFHMLYTNDSTNTVACIVAYAVVYILYVYNWQLAVMNTIPQGRFTQCTVFYV